MSCRQRATTHLKSRHIIAMVSEDPAFPFLNGIDCRDAFTAPPIDDIEHPQQSNHGIETILA